MTPFCADFKVDWKIRITASTETRLCEILEASIIALKRPSLNQLVDFDHLKLFRNGVTYIFYIINGRIEIEYKYMSSSNFSIYLLLYVFLAFTLKHLTTAIVCKMLLDIIF